MTNIERTPDRLALQSGSTTIVLDKQAGEAVLRRKLLFWARKPVTRPLNSISRVKLDTSIDAASKAELCSVMLLMREGGGWMLSARDKQDATAAIATVREFLGISEMTQ
jgi:hypothetical protein